MKCAVCITTRGNLHMAEESLESAWTLFPHDGPGHFIVVSADEPTSAAGRVLTAWAAKKGDGVDLTFEPGCPRGEGRRRAFDAAKRVGATHVVQSVDTDMVYHAPLRAIVDLYREHYAHRDIFLQMVGWNITRVETMEALGGWREGWQVLEDRVVWKRAIDTGRLIYLDVDGTDHVRAEHRRTWWRAKLRHYQYRYHEVRYAKLVEHTDITVHAPKDPTVIAKVRDVRADLAAYWERTPRRHMV